MKERIDNMDLIVATRDLLKGSLGGIAIYDAVYPVLFDAEKNRVFFNRMEVNLVNRNASGVEIPGKRTKILQFMFSLVDWRLGKAALTAVLLNISAEKIIPKCPLKKRSAKKKCDKIVGYLKRMLDLYGVIFNEVIF